MMKSKIILLFILFPLLSYSQTEPSFCTEMLSKAKNALKVKNYNKSREYCESGLQLCGETVDSFKVTVKRINEAIESEKNKNQRLIDALYFYENKFALANKSNKFGFIDKNGSIRIPHKYISLEQFNQYGYAKAETCFENLLIDTLGREFLASYTLPPEIEISNYMALQIEVENFDTITEIIDNAKQLNLLFLSNQIQYITDDEGIIIVDNDCYTPMFEFNEVQDSDLTKLKELIMKLSKIEDLSVLSLENFNLQKLPIEIKYLQQLEKLYLFGNYLSTQEAKQLQNLLPNCEIYL